MPWSSLRGFSEARDLLDGLDPIALTEAIRDESGAIIDFRYIGANEAFGEAVGGQVDDLIGHNLLELSPSYRESGLFESFRQVVETSESFSAELPWSGEQLDLGYFELTLRKFGDGCVASGHREFAGVVNEDGQPRGESAPSPLVLLDREGVITSWSDAASALYGWTSDEVIGREDIAITNGDREMESLLLARVFRGETLPPMASQRLTRDGNVVDVEVTLAPLRDADGEVIGATMLHRNITERVVIGGSAAGASNAAGALADAMAEFVVLLDPVLDDSGALVGLKYDYVNQAFAAMMAMSPEQIVGQSLADVFPTVNSTGLVDSLLRVVQTGIPFVSELPWNEGRHVRAIVETRATRFGRGLLITGQDVTDRRRVERQLLGEGMVDPLTGLVNRRVLIDRLRHDLSRLQRDPGEIAVLFIDLDGFKGVNDTLGHDAGDDVLREVGRRLRLATRNGDTTARIGGDEFVVVLSSVMNRREPAMVAARIHEALAMPMAIPAGPVRLGTSIGIAMSADAAAVTSDALIEPEELVRRADLAMYRAKQRKGDRFEFYDEQISEEIHARVATEQALRAAVEHDEFEPWYQPEVDLATGRVVGLEVLTRWVKSDGSLIPAAEWVEHAEDAGLIIRLDRRVRIQACQEFSQWPREGLAGFTRLWLNMSALELLEPDAASTLLSTIHDAGLLPTDVGVEITETALLGDPIATAANIDAFADAGVCVAIDDFGTGYASLSALRELRVDTIKIDRSFTEGVPGDVFDDAVVAATVAISETLDLRVVGEGVETIEQRDALVAAGCMVGQGYLYAPAMSGKRVGELLASGRCLGPAE